MQNTCCHLDQIYAESIMIVYVYSWCSVSMSLELQVYKSITKISWFKAPFGQFSGLKTCFYSSEEEYFAWEGIVFRENNYIAHHPLIYMVYLVT